MCCCPARCLQLDEDDELMWGRGGAGADSAEYRRFLQSLRELPELPSVTVEGEDSGGRAAAGFGRGCVLSMRRVFNLTPSL